MNNKNNVFFYEIINKYFNTKKENKKILFNMIIIFILEYKLIKIVTIKNGFSKLLRNLEDISIDIPNTYNYISDIINILIDKKILSKEYIKIILKKNLKNKLHNIIINKINI